jgi:hypothetical protein
MLKPWKKDNIKSIYIDRLDFDNFMQVILSNLIVGIRYSLLFKVKYNNTQFGMLGPQQGFKLINLDDLSKVELLYDDLIERIENFMDKYNCDEIELIQILYIALSENPKLKVTNINNIHLDRNLVKVKEIKDKFNFKFLPLTINTNYYGNLLVGDDYIFYLDKINKERELLGKSELDENNIHTMYLYNDKYIIINNIKKDSVINRWIYSASSGVLLENVIDNIINEKIFTRNISNVGITISKDKIINLEVNKNLSIIKYDSKFTKELANPFIGSLDLEAFTDLDGYAKIYAIGFAILNGDIKTFYLQKDQNSNDLLLDCFNLLLNKYNGYIFYIHNFGKYDSIFILKILIEANKKIGSVYYKLEPVYKDDIMLKLDIKVKNKKITIIDSYNLLNTGLYELSRSFNLDVTKGFFPHKFVKRDTLYYIGTTPSRNYWCSLKNNITLNEYKELYTKNWDLKNECLLYLKKDLVSLLNVMDTFNKYIIKNYDVQMTQCRTISRLALNIFLKHYLKESKIPIIKSHMFDDIKQAYYGGVTEVYRPLGKNLLYYDVNSLYPYSALNSLPGNKCVYLESLNNISLNLNDLFGFFYCEIETNNNYLGLLPVRRDIGLIMPNGKWCGWYFSEELKFAAINGYKINVIKGYNFNKEENVFDSYVQDLYNIKSINTGHIRAITKSLLNNLLGRFGMNINKPKTDIVNRDELELILSTREINSIRELTEDDFILTYYPNISKDICKSHEIDYIKALKTKFDMEKDREMKDVSLSTAAAVTSYSRIFMSKIKLDILSKGGKIYYTDTDSIVTDITLDDNIVGNKLGQFKLVYKTVKGYFISAKTYCLVLMNKSTVIKVKGLYNKSLTLNKFKNLYKGVNVKGKKEDTETVYNKGSVVIKEKKIKLNFDSYRKREKIYKNNKWIDTKPLILNIDDNKKLSNNSTLKYTKNTLTTTNLFTNKKTSYTNKKKKKT